MRNGIVWWTRPTALVAAFLVAACGMESRRGSGGGTGGGGGEGGGGGYPEQLECEPGCPAGRTCEVGECIPGTPAHVFGRSLGERELHFIDSLKIENEGATAQTVIARVELQGYSEPGEQRVDLGAFETKTVPADVTFDFDKLYSVTTPVMAAVRVQLLQGGEVVDVHSRQVAVEPKNKISWFREKSDGTIVDLRPFVVVMVTPHDRDNQIETLISEAVAYTERGAIVGYEPGGTGDFIVDEVEAVFSALRARGMTYTNVPGAYFDGAQNVKLPAESLATGSQNCIDGTLVFASAFEAMGLQPIIVFKTGHAFVGVRLAPGGDIVVFVETTMVSAAEPQAALEKGLEQWEELLQGGDPFFLAVDVHSYRQVGLTPLNE